MFERFDDGARVALDHAFEEATAFGHSQVGTEHLLLGLLGDPRSGAARSLRECGATLEACRAKVEEAAVSKRSPSPRAELTLTDRATRALDRANRLSLRQRCEYVETDHVLLSVLDVEGTAGQVLRGLGVDMASVREAIRSGGSADSGAEASSSNRHSPNGTDLSCPKCGLSLAGALAHRSVASTGEAGDKIRWLILYCSACGVALGAHHVAG